MHTVKFLLAKHGLKLLIERVKKVFIKLKTRKMGIVVNQVEKNSSYRFFKGHEIVFVVFEIS